MPKRVERFPGSKVSESYDFARKAISFGLDGRWKRAALRASKTRGERLRQVDIGTGSGSMLTAGMARFKIRVGVDHEVAMLARARQRVSGASWVAGDIGAMPLRQQTFDIVTAAYVLRYAADTLEIIRPAHELLRPGGTFVAYELTSPTSHLLRLVFVSYLIASTTLLGLLLHGDPRLYWHLWQSLGNFDLRNLLDVLRAEGFAEAEVGTAACGTVVWVVAQRP